MLLSFQHAQNYLRALVSNRFVNRLKYEALWFKWLKVKVNFFNVWRCKSEKLVSRFSIICTTLCSNIWFVWNHARFRSLKTCKSCAIPYYDPFMILMHAQFLYGYCMTFTQPNVTIYDLVFISCFFYAGQPGMLKPVISKIAILRSRLFYSFSLVSDSKISVASGYSSEFSECKHCRETFFKWVKNWKNSQFEPKLSYNGYTQLLQFWP